MTDVSFTEQGWEDYLFWQQNNRKILKRLNRLIEDAKRHPYEGLGKPEGLKGNLSGLWSRRVDDTNRLVYLVIEDSIEIWQCRGHYED